MKNVLLIDDDPVVTSVYQSLFATAGFNVSIAEDGEAGFAAALRYRPDAVLLDLSMPKLNGIQWLEKARRDSRLEKMPIIVFTAGQIGWQLTAAKNSDATIVLSKKVADPQTVVRTVNNVIAAGSWTV